MAFDFKKEYKEFYMPKTKPEIVNVSKASLNMLFRRLRDFGGKKAM